MYIWGHWPVIAVCAVALFCLRRERYRMLRNAILVSGAIGFLFFALLPTAPPRLADVGLVDTIVERSSSYRALQPPSVTNQYAAMPSLHFGWNLLVGVVLFGSTRSRAVRAFALLMPAAMGFSVVATANHWVIDVVAGALVVIVGLLAARLLQATRRRHRRHPRKAGRAGRVLNWTR
jgi:membrane-associated phospholipid phosphatase